MSCMHTVFFSSLPEKGTQKGVGFMQNMALNGIPVCFGGIPGGMAENFPDSVFERLASMALWHLIKEVMD